MCYIDAFIKNEKICVVERQNNIRRFKEYPIKWVSYYEDKNGTYKSINGKYYKKIESIGNKKKFLEKKYSVKANVFYEDDFNVIFRCLYENYKNKEIPKLNICLFDIEVEFDPKKGFALVEEPGKKNNSLYYYGEIIAITLYLKWLDKLVTLCRYPTTIKSLDEAENILKDIENVYVFEEEKELLEAFLTLIEDVDILSGWNSEKYDIPYLIGRINKIFPNSKEYLKKFCVLDMLPSKKELVQYKKKYITYNFFGKIHIDYLSLYRKHKQQQFQSYRLDFIGEKEVNMKKIPYEKNLYELYNFDYRKFIEYNRRDVEILYNIDNKLKFIELANQIAHNNCVLIQTTMGSVNLIEQAIINEAHDQNLIIDIKRNKNTSNNNEYDENIYIEEEDTETTEKKKNINDHVLGAFVIHPKKGLHDFIGGVDINSLYPSTIRSLNIGNETLYAQLRPTYTEKYLNEKSKEDKKEILQEALQNLFGTLEYQKVLQKSKDLIIIDFEKPEKCSIELTGEEIYNFIFDSESDFCISAYGTIFYKKQKSIISQILEKWYTERKQMQQRSKEFLKIYNVNFISFKDLDCDENDELWLKKCFNGEG